MHTTAKIIVFLMFMSLAAGQSLCAGWVPHAWCWLPLEPAGDVHPCADGLPLASGKRGNVSFQLHYMVKPIEALVPGGNAAVAPAVAPPGLKFGAALASPDGKHYALVIRQEEEKTLVLVAHSHGAEPAASAAHALLLDSRFVQVKGNGAAGELLPSRRAIIGIPAGFRRVGAATWLNQAAGSAADAAVLRIMTFFKRGTIEEFQNAAESRLRVLGYRAIDGGQVNVLGRSHAVRRFVQGSSDGADARRAAVIYLEEGEWHHAILCEARSTENLENIVRTVQGRSVACDVMPHVPDGSRFRLPRDVARVSAVRDNQGVVRLAWLSADRVPLAWTGSTVIVEWLDGSKKPLETTRIRHSYQASLHGAGLRAPLDARFIVLRGQVHEPIEAGIAQPPGLP